MTEPWIERTQQTLGNLIQKPKLGDKYLKKPPFRFLHDVLSEVVRATNFGGGLYNAAEQDAGTIGDKQAKLDFLNKMISCVSFALGERLDVSANKIVAGLEPEKTNGFLVKLWEAATTKIDASPDAVQRVLQGDSAVVEKKKKDKDKKDKKDEEGGEAPPADDAKEEERAKRKEEERAKRKEAERAKRKEEEEKEKSARKAQDAAAAADADDAAKKKDEEKQRKKDEERAKRKEEEKRKKEEEKAAAAKEKAAAEKPAPAAEKERAAPVKATAAAADVPPAPAAEADERVEIGGGGGDGPKRERPLTAGRKPPKITSKVRTKQDEPGMQAKAQEGPALITEDDGGQDDDMFVQDTIDRPKEYIDDSGAGGKLVRELMEEKKKTEQQEQAQEEDKKSGIRMGKLKRKKDAQDTKYSEVDIGQLTGIIQQLCQTVNPLGKSIDMIYNDIAAMGKELETWRGEHRTACERQQVEKEITEKEMAPMYTKLAEIEDLVAEQQSKTVAIRSRILQQDTQIHNLLETIAQAEGTR